MNNKPFWKDITREERYFCSFLFHDIRCHDLNKINSPFLRAIRKGADKSSPLYSGLKNVSILDVGYEVCFFRDYANAGLASPIDQIINRNKSSLEQLDAYQRVIKGLRGKEISLIKQTFDLVLWTSDNQMLIIEAKAHEGFTRKQIDYLDIARCLIESTFSDHTPSVRLVALTSAQYEKNCRVKDRFDAFITWRNIQDVYRKNSPIYRRAEKVYKE